MEGFWNIRVSDLIKSEFYQGYAGGMWKMKCREAWRQGDLFESCYEIQEKEVKVLFLNKSKK